MGDDDGGAASVDMTYGEMALPYLPSTMNVSVSDRSTVPLPASNLQLTV